MSRPPHGTGLDVTLPAGWTAALPTPRSGERVDHAFLVPVRRLFQPEADPTEEFPDQTASAEGYLVAPGALLTIALSVSDSAGTELLEAVWGALRRKGIGLRQTTVLNDRGRVVSLMTVRLGTAPELVALAESQLLMPIRARNGFAEVHLLATSSDFDALRGRLATPGAAPVPAVASSIPPVHDVGALVPQDWAFLGLLSAVGAFDGAETAAPAVLADALGIDLQLFVERARAAELGLSGLVTDLFGAGEPRATEEAS
jgi:hypothetical protein